MSLPKVSVRIPTYNRANLLLESLNSVTKQKGVHLQIVLMDNGSTDNTQEVISGWIATVSPDIDVVLLREYENSFDNIPKMDTYLTGDYIVQFTDDDVMLEDNLKLKAGIMEAYRNTGMVSSTVGMIDYNSNTIPGYKGGNIESAVVRFEDLVVTSLLPMPATMFRKDAYFTPVMNGCDPGGEWSLHLEVIHKGWSAICLHTPMVMLRIHDGSDTNVRGIEGGKFIDMHFRCWEHWIRQRGFKPSKRCKQNIVETYSSLLLGRWNYSILAFHDDMARLTEMIEGEYVQGVQ